MVGYRVGNTLTDHGTVSRGVCETEGGYLTGIVERTAISRDGNEAVFEADGKEVRIPLTTPVSMNFWGFHPALLADLNRCLCDFLRTLAPEDNTSECLLPTAMDALISAGVTQTRLLPTSGSWFGLTTPGDRPGVLAALRDLRAEGVYPQTLWQK